MFVQIGSRAVREENISTAEFPIAVGGAITIYMIGGSQLTLRGEDAAAFMSWWNREADLYVCRPYTPPRFETCSPQEEDDLEETGEMNFQDLEEDELPF